MYDVEKNFEYIQNSETKVSLFHISQATSATFTDLYFKDTSLFYIKRGSKRVVTPEQGELMGKEGDLMIFGSGSSITMENKPVFNENYRAIGVRFSQDLIEMVYKDVLTSKQLPEVQIISGSEESPALIFDLIQNTLKDETLPLSIKNHRLVEPLIWLRDLGIILPTSVKDHPIRKVRKLLETDLRYPWRAEEVACYLGMSEATMRRYLANMGQGFSKILLNCRLDKALTLLLTTNEQISYIALDCGFKTPSHFSDAFRKRFDIKPKDIRQTAQ